MTTSNAAFACATVMPGFNRPSTGNNSDLPGSSLDDVRRPRSRAPREIEARRHDADDGAAHGVQRHVLSDDRGIRSETAAPQLIADHDDRLASILAVVGQERPPHRRLDGERVEELRGDVSHLDDHGIAGACQVARCTCVNAARF